MARMIPFSPLWFRMKKFYRSKSYFQNAVEELIAASPETGHAKEVTVLAANARFFTKPTVVLSGTVANAHDRAGAVGIVENHSRGTVEVIDKMVVLNGKSADVT